VVEQPSAPVRRDHIKEFPGQGGLLDGDPAEQPSRVGVVAAVDDIGRFVLLDREQIRYRAVSGPVGDDPRRGGGGKPC
jgi:hypothetical protein